jgi:hypothetical protein
MYGLQFVVVILLSVNVTILIRNMVGVLIPFDSGRKNDL